MGNCVAGYLRESPLVLFHLHLMNAPEVTYDFHIPSAHVHWSIHSDAIHITECASESGVTVHGVKADAVFMMCRNALACKREYSVFHELSDKPYHLKAAKDMIDVLQSFVDSKTSKEEDDDTTAD